MNAADNVSTDVNIHGGGERLPCIELTLDALPEVQQPVLAENSQTGVSAQNALSRTGKIRCESLSSSKTIICASEAEDIILVSSDVNKFKRGQSVRITDGLLTIASAYVPNAFLEKCQLQS